MEQEMKLDWKKFAEAAEHWLVLFDEAFSKRAMPFHQRPYQAAMWLIRDGITELPFGDSKEDDHFEKVWFAALVVAIRRWYEDRYGADALNPPKTKLPGLIMLHGTPLKLDINETVKKVEVEGETSWMIWADSIHETETILSFLPTKPNLDTLPPEERAAFEECIKTTIERTRRTNIALRTASGLPAEATQMVPGIIRHFEKGVSDILSLSPANAAVAIWELHLAVEKTFKVFLYQHKANIKVHNLATLSEQAKGFGLTVKPSVLNKLPHWKKSADFRYVEEEADIGYAVEMYVVALQLVDEIAAKLQRELVINNAGLLIKKPKWVGR